MERYNANYIGGDINGGAQMLSQIFTRPAPRLDPYATVKVSLLGLNRPAAESACGYNAGRR